VLEDTMPRLGIKIEEGMGDRHRQAHDHGSRLPDHHHVTRGRSVLKLWGPAQKAAGEGFDPIEAFAAVSRGRRCGDLPSGAVIRDILHRSTTFASCAGVAGRRAGARKAAGG
jgi:hypothetical protein